MNYCTEAEKWYEIAHKTLMNNIPNHQERSAVARNVIVFVGDGMGLSTLTAARILKGQRSGQPGEEARLVWDDFPSVALAQVFINIIVFFVQLL